MDFDEESVAIYQREFDFDSLFDFPLCGNIVDVLIRNEDYKPPADRRGMTAIAGPLRSTGPEVIGVLDTDYKYNNANRLITLVDNHDLEKRLMNWALAYSGGDRTRAAGLVTYVLTFQFTTRGIPQVYYGTEVGLEGERSEGGDHFLRREMPWEKIDPHTHEPFAVFQLEKMIYHHLRKLIALRRDNEALTFGYLFTLHSCFDLYAFMREYRGNTIIVVMNNSVDPVSRSLVVNIHENPNAPARIKENLLRRKTLVNVFSRDEKIVCSEDCKIVFKVGGKEARVFKLV